MLNWILRFSLNNRKVVVMVAAAILIAGGFAISRLSVDVLPDLTRPRVSIFVESEGRPPEEVERQIVLPIETALQGAPGIEKVRSNCTPGLGLVYAEFGYGTKILDARQIVGERLKTVKELPKGVTPEMGPITSITGQIMTIGISADTTSPMELRTLADYTIRRRIKAIKGIAEVIVSGGEVMQFQVKPNPEAMVAHGVTLEQIKGAVRKASDNTSGNYIDYKGQQLLINHEARIKTVKELEQSVVVHKDGTSVLLKHVAKVERDGKYKIGDAGLNGKPGVLLIVEKQPGYNTLALTRQVEEAVAELEPALPPDVKVNPKVLRQADFINFALDNVFEALRDGIILLVIILFVFLRNFRTTFITILSIPTSFMITCIFFYLFGFSINVMTLGGLAIAVGELVDDSIVDVENIFKRLREHKIRGSKEHFLKIAYKASMEVRSSILYSTVIVVVIFVPLFLMQGMEGRLFKPLGIAYIVSIIASTVVSITLTPALSALLLPQAKIITKEKESWLVRKLKAWDERLLGFTLQHGRLVATITVLIFLGTVGTLPFMGSEFLPPFNENGLTINVATPPGTSLEEASRIGTLAEKEILKVPEVAFTARRNGRSELDEHIEPVGNADIEVSFRKVKGGRSKKEVIADIRDRLAVIRGANVNIGQPLSHRMDHLVSGVSAKIAIKIYGEDLFKLKWYAESVEHTIGEIPGVVDVYVQKQDLTDQLIISPDEDALEFYGFQRGEFVGQLETLLKGTVENEVIDEEKRFDMIVKLDSIHKQNQHTIGRILITTHQGQLVPLRDVAKIELEKRPSRIAHEDTRRYILVSCNVEGRDEGSVVKDIQKEVRASVPMDQGYYVTYEGLFQNSRRSMQTMLGLGALALVVIWLLLYAKFRSNLIVFQILMSIPLAMIGGVIAVLLMGGTFSVASLVGFIALAGIASRNGIMLISRYLDLIEKEGHEFNDATLIRGSLERLVPVMMTALTAILALTPILFYPGAPGKAILYQVAAVIVGGLISSTFLDIVTTPVFFKLIGKKAVEQYLEGKGSEKVL